MPGQTTKILALLLPTAVLGPPSRWSREEPIPIRADRAGNTPLHVAAQKGSLELVKNLLAKGANVNAQNAPTELTGFRPVGGLQTPLLIAARENHIDVMKALIDARADVTLKPPGRRRFLPFRRRKRSCGSSEVRFSIRQRREGCG
jgi:ankyrin repeat protein